MPFKTFFKIFYRGGGGGGEVRGGFHFGVFHFGVLFLIFLLYKNETSITKNINLTMVA